MSDGPERERAGGAESDTRELEVVELRSPGYSEAVLVALVGAIAWLVSGAPGTTGRLVALVLFAAAAIRTVAALRRPRVPSPVRARIEAGAIHVGTRVIARGEIRDASLAPAYGVFVVALRTRFRHHEICVRTREEGEGLLAALGFRPGRARWYPLGLSLPALLLAVAMIAPVLVVAAPLPARTLGLGIAAALVSSMLRALGGTRALVVGEDGVRVESWGRARFVAFTDLLEVKARAGRETITLHTKRAERIALGTSLAGRGQEVRIAGAIREALEQWRATSIARERSSGAMDRPLPIVATPGSAGGYRVASVPAGRLLDVIEDRAASLKVRIAAAEALTLEDDDAGAEERVARVRGATASAALRDALEKRRRA